MRGFTDNIIFQTTLSIYSKTIGDEAMVKAVIAGFNQTEAFIVLKPFAIFLVGVVIYSIFIFKFYRFLARKDIFELNLDRYNTAKHPSPHKILSVIFYVVKYVLFFPIFAFFWFVVLTVLLSFLSKDQTIQQVLLVSIAVVSAIRITAYYNEDLSKDFAKMLPFALLGIFLVDKSYFSFPETCAKLYEIPSQWNAMFYYLVFIIVLEFLLRVSYSMRKR